MLKLLPVGLLTFVWATFFSTQAFAQDRTVSGRVLDECSSGMPGVNVLLKGTTRGTKTDRDGKL
jgi:hypothetical protein